MSVLQLLLIILTVIALSAGQVLFKMAAIKIEFTLDGFLNSLLNINLIVALVVYFFATFMWLLVLNVTPLRVAYPFAALAFFIVPVLAHFFLGENINWNTFAGAGFIAIGVLISVYK